MAEWIDAFAPHFRVIIHDHRGAGQSSHSMITYSVDQMASDVIKLMDGLDIEKAHYAGHSTGGAIGKEHREPVENDPEGDHYRQGQGQDLSPGKGRLGHKLRVDAPPDAQFGRWARSSPGTSHPLPGWSALIERLLTTGIVKSVIAAQAAEAT